MMPSPAMLVTRESPFQRYCANRLFRAGVVDRVIVEEGASLPGEHLTIRDLLWKSRQALEAMRAHPMASLRLACLHARNLLRYSRYYGRRAFYHRHILQHHYDAFDSRLPLVRVKDVNGADTVACLQQRQPGLILVYGTRLIRRDLLDALPGPWVNLHWGWSPAYRGEGIVSALACEGPAALGVTVHLLDHGIDSGEILYQARPSVSPVDNFYSIGLKLTVVGTELLVKVAEAYARDGRLLGTRQVTKTSQLFSGRYLREHPEVYGRAWKNLRTGWRR